jgi:Domain of unknown function (DUF4915)
MSNAMSLNHQGMELFDQPRLLISIQNVALDPRPSCLLLFDVASQRKQWIDIGLGQLLASGLGIYGDDRHIFHVCIANADFSTHLVVLDRSTLDVIHVRPLPEVEDGHSVLHYVDELIVVSTGTDQIIAYPLCDADLGKPRILWSPTDSGTDTHHINSLCVADGELLCSAFGPKDDDSWATARSGYVRNLTTDTMLIQGLRQPHSATWHDGELYFCNSLEGSINTTYGVVAYLYGYARGLTFGIDGTMYAGTSLSRRPPQQSDDTAVFRNPGDEGDLHGQCALIRMTESGTNRVETGMSPFGNEIYDIVVL